MPQLNLSPVWLRRAAVVVLIAGVVACTAEAGSGPADPTLLPPGETQGPVTSSTVPGSGTVSTTRTPLPGFGEVAVEVTKVDGTIVSWCLLLADTPELRQRGLMTVTDPELGGYDGMLFRFDQDTTTGFWMRNTPQQLSIAYLDAAGGVVSITEMAPCGDSDDCPGYPPSGPYRRTVEVPVAAGGVGALGIEPGAVLVEAGASCSETDGT